MSTIWLFLSWSATFFALISNIFFVTNSYRLPMKILVTFLPFDKIFSLNWFLNYLCQVISSLFSAIFIFTYVPMTLILLNHTCWEIDISIVLVYNLNQMFEYKISMNSLLRKEIIEKQLKAIVEVTCRAQEWQRKVQSLLGINLFM